MTIDRSRDGNRSYWQETFDLTTLWLAEGLSALPLLIF